MKELFPCPFCGGEAEMKQTKKKSLRVRCNSCLMGVEQSVIKYSIEWLEGKLIGTWNQRIQK